MCEEGCVCERERESGWRGGDEWRNDRKGKVCHSPQRDQEHRVQWLNPSPLTPRQYISSFFSPQILAYIWYLPNLRGMIPRGPSQGLSCSVLVFTNFPGAPCNTPCNEFFFVFSKELTCHQNSIILDARWFQKKDVNISRYSLHYFVFEGFHNFFPVKNVLLVHMYLYSVFYVLCPLADLKNHYQGITLNSLKLSVVTVISLIL